jgi:DNA-binding NarL/FixJ family response regulator
MESGISIGPLLNSPPLEVTITFSYVHWVLDTICYILDWSRMSIHLVLADNHPLMLEGLTALFHKEPRMRVVARCGTGEETLQAVQRHRPDVLIFDISLHGKDGFAVLQEIARLQLPTRAVLFTASLSDAVAIQALRMGVKGVVLKEMAPSLLVQCVRKVHAGGQWLERLSVGRVLNKLVQHDERRQEIERVLTRRELDIVRLIMRGLRNKEIAQQLFLGESTIKVHLHHIYTKLHINNRLALLHYAHTEGME